MRAALPFAPPGHMLGRGMPFGGRGHFGGHVGGAMHHHHVERPPRPMPAPIPLDPVTNPRSIEAVVKLRGLPFEATPRDITDWLNDAIRNREALLSQEVRAPLVPPAGPRCAVQPRGARVRPHGRTAPGCSAKKSVRT